VRVCVCAYVYVCVRTIRIQSTAVWGRRGRGGNDRRRGTHSRLRQYARTVRIYIYPMHANRPYTYFIMYVCVYIRVYTCCVRRTSVFNSYRRGGEYVARTVYAECATCSWGIRLLSLRPVALPTADARRTLRPSL